jgi:hypothetical protein
VDVLDPLRLWTLCGGHGDLLPLRCRCIISTQARIGVREKHWTVDALTRAGENAHVVESKGTVASVFHDLPFLATTITMTVETTDERSVAT